MSISFINNIIKYSMSGGDGGDSLSVGLTDTDGDDGVVDYEPVLKKSSGQTGSVKSNTFLIVILCIVAFLVIGGTIVGIVYYLQSKNNTDTSSGDSDPLPENSADDTDSHDAEIEDSSGDEESSEESDEESSVGDEEAEEEEEEKVGMNSDEEIIDSDSDDEIAGEIGDESNIDDVLPIETSGSDEGTVASTDEDESSDPLDNFTILYDNSKTTCTGPYNYFSGVNESACAEKCNNNSSCTHFGTTTNNNTDYCYLYDSCNTHTLSSSWTTYQKN